MNTFECLTRGACGIALVTLAACTAKSDGAPAPAASAAASASASQSAKSPQGGGGPVTVTTVRPNKRDFSIVFKASGTVTPLNSVDIKPQVTNAIAKVHVREGQFVRAGELLFTLDARTDEANVAKAQAQLTRDRAALADAQRQYARAQELFGQNFISQGALDTSRTQVDLQTAAVAADQAAVDAARVPLSYARVVAPSAGRAGAINVFAGSTVLANQTTLVTITQLDPIAVAFTFPQTRLGDALAALKDGGAPVSATLAGEAASFQGRLKFVDNLVDPLGGTVKAKAVFDNRDAKLWPGAFVEVSQTLGVIKDALVLPQEAIVQNARGTLVYVVKDGKAEGQPVKVLVAQGPDAVVSGIGPDAVVVLGGKQNLRPGSAVVERAKEVPMPEGSGKKKPVAP